MKIDLSQEDLFLIEMAVDEAMWHLEPSTPFYDKLGLLNQRINAMRHASEDSKED
jgi:hypothetical protein